MLIHASSGLRQTKPQESISPTEPSKRAQVQHAFNGSGILKYDKDRQGKRQGLVVIS